MLVFKSDTKAWNRLPTGGTGNEGGFLQFSEANTGLKTKKTKKNVLELGVDPRSKWTNDMVCTKFLGEGGGPEPKNKVLNGAKVESKLLGTNNTCLEADLSILLSFQCKLKKKQIEKHF